MIFLINKFYRNRKDFLMKKEYLMAPGPTPVPPEVLLEMAHPIFHHRTPRFKSLFSEVNIGLKKIFKTSNPVLTLAASGSGAMESSISNTLSKGDKAVVINGGKFGERFGLICKAYGVDVIEIEVEWGSSIDPSKLESVLKENPDVKAVFATLCETSTGVLTDINALGKVVDKTDAILVVDAISGLGADDMRADEWGVDMVIGGSQKGLMLPPGLAFISVSKKAEALMSKSDLPKFYFDLKKAIKSYSGDDTPWTPAVTLVIGLKKIIDMFLDEGVDNVISRHSRLASAARKGVTAMGMELFAPNCPSNAVTSVKVPDGVDGLAFVKGIRDDIGVTIAGGQAHMKGKIFRLAHLGYADDFGLLTALAATEKMMKKLGYNFEPGVALKAAQELLI